MLLLAIDSATPVAGVALLQDDRLLKEEFSNYGKTHAEVLMPMIDRVLQGCQYRVADLDGIAISVGPGSFTGLRIGMAAAKGMGLGAGKPLLAVSTLEMLAANVIGFDTMICPVLDARKNEVYSGIYLCAGRKLQCIRHPSALPPEMLVELIKDAGRELGMGQCMLLGDGLFTYGGYLQEKLGGIYTQAPPHLDLPRASALAVLAMEKLKQGQTEDIFSLRPLYLRLSEAEIRRKKGE